ncbi:MAG TPA: CAP domain-containing protein [Acidimicrobiia bacterium]|nr:CAP domain-containing protein [Acidimicrobiia bacterium]
MLSSLGTRRARLLASALVVATLTAGCFSGQSHSSRQVPLPASGLTREVYDLVNADRAANGLPALTWNAQLGGLAQSWSETMASTGRFEHSDLDATLASPEFDGFRRLGENILVGSCNMTAAEMEQAWMNSPGHRANILGSFNVIGVGVVCSGGRVWATQSFGTV